MIDSRTVPLLEREDQLELVGQLLDDVREGRGALVLLEGPAGIGKTRLLGATCARADALGLQVLRARGGELERDFSYGVVRQLFEPPLVASSEDERARLLDGAAHLAAPLFEFEDAGEASAGGEDASYRTLHGLFWLTANLVELAPVLLAVDDLHWCDPPSLRFLAYLARRLDGLPVVLAAWVRTREPGMDEAILTQLESEPLATLVRPAPLSLEAVAQLLRTRLASDPAPLFLETVYTSCGGNPLLLNELVHAVLVERIEPSADVPPRGRASVVATLHEAAQRASGEGAADVARSYLDRALAEPPDEHQRADVLFELGSAELRSGQPGAIGHLQEALGLVQGQPRSVEIALALANAHFAWDVYLFEAADGLQRTIESLDTRDAALAQRLEAELIMWARFDARLYSMARERLARIADRASEESLGGRMLLMLIASELARTGESPDRARELVGRALVGGALLGDETREAYMVAVAVLVSLDELDDADHGVRRRGRHRAGRDPGRGVRRRRQTHCLGHEPRGHGRQLRSQAASGSKLDHRQAGRVAKASPAEAGCLQRSWPPQSRSACPGPR